MHYREFYLAQGLWYWPSSGSSRFESGLVHENSAIHLFICFFVTSQFILCLRTYPRKLIFDQLGHYNYLIQCAKSLHCFSCLKMNKCWRYVRINVIYLVHKMADINRKLWSGVYGQHIVQSWDTQRGFKTALTHYQTTNFRLFQTERVCRWQFQIWRKWHKVIQTGRKHCGKRSNFPFSHSVFKRPVSQGRQKVSLCGNGLNLNPFPNKPLSLCVCSTSLLETLLEKEKLVMMSNFSFFHSVFYTFVELSAIFIKFKIDICKLCRFGRV